MFIGAGPAAEAAAAALRPRRDVLAITNSLCVAAILADGRRLAVLGGELSTASGAAPGALVGAATLEALARWKLDLAILGCAALDRDGDMLETDMRLAVVHRAAMAQARRTALIVEGARVLRSAPARVGSLRDVAQVFTDRSLPPALATLCAGWDCRVEIPRAQPVAAA